MKTPDSTTASKKPRRNRFGCALSVLCALAVVTLIAGLSYFVWYSNARGQLESEIARIQDRGEPLWFRDLAPKVTDPDQNGAELFLQALAKMRMPSQALVNSVVATPQDPAGDDPLIVAELARNREVLDLLAEAMRKPTFRLPIDYNTTQPFSIVLDDVQSARDLVRLLSGHVTAALAAGEQDRAVETIERMFDLSELLRDEPFTITQLIRIAITAVAHASLKQAMAQIDLTPQQFASLDDRLARMEKEFTLAPAMIAERAASFTTLQHLDENLSILQESYPADSGYESSSLHGWARGVIQPNRMADEANVLRIMSEVVDAIDRPGRQGSDMIQEIEARVQNAPRSYVFSRLLLPALVNVREAGLRHREKLLTARLGIRVDRYFAEHGRFPASLDELTDDKLSTIPVDVFAGKPHAYRVLPDGFVVYSVGPNGIDEGGGQTPDQIEFFTNFDVHYPAQ